MDLSISQDINAGRSNLDDILIYLKRLKKYTETRIQEISSMDHLNPKIGGQTPQNAKNGINK